MVGKKNKRKKQSTSYTPDIRQAALSSGLKGCIGDHIPSLRFIIVIFATRLLFDVGKCSSALNWPLNDKMALHTVDG